MATIYEVAKQAGVSVATVSRVLNESVKVKAETRDRVMAAMADLDYRPNVFAQSLASNRTNCVGVLVSELNGPFFGPILSVIEKTLKQAGKFAIITAAHSDAAKEEEGIRFLAERKCDALILHVEALSDDDFIRLSEEMLPFVLLNRRIPRLEEHCVYLDNELGGYLATKSVLELGHRAIGYISGPRNWQDAEARLAGHRRALREYGVEEDERLMYRADFKMESGGKGARALLESGLPVTAIVCANDEMATGAMVWLRSRKLHVPEDISIMGFDNVRWTRFLNPKLSTVNYPLEKMSQMAAHWVLKNVYGDESLEIQRSFEPTVMLRESTGPVPEKGGMASLPGASPMTL